MSDTIDAAAPTSTESAGQGVLTGGADAEPVSLSPHDLTRLAQGFSFIFWGSLAVLSTMTDFWVTLTVLPIIAEASAAPTFRVYPLVIGGAGAFGMLAGSWRLYQTRDLAHDWKNYTHGLLVTATLIAYLFPFFCMWLRLPANMYLLCHALIWVGMLIGHLSLLSVAVGTLARLVGRPWLAGQALLYGGVVFIVLFAPFVLFARSLILITWRGDDPLAALQLLMEHVHPAYVLAALIPFSLTLSLAWTAKDMALRGLTARDSKKPDDPESA
jgi:hypothetical protein